MKDIKRRSFLKSFVGFLALPFVPKAKSNEFKMRFRGEAPNDTAAVWCYSYDEKSGGYKRINDWPSGLPSGGLNEEMLGDKYIFHNLEAKGCPINFLMNGKTYFLEDGKEYKLPKNVIHHLNKLKCVYYRQVESSKSGIYELIYDHDEFRFNAEIIK